MSKTAYFVGIKGVGMTALAVYLKQKGYKVFGSDIENRFPTDVILSKYKISITKGFKKENIKKRYDTVVVTGAHGGMTNPEAQQAKKIGLSVYMHGQFLGMLVNEKEGIAVAGCHGKTTASALIASLLTHVGLDPSYAIGTSYINDLGPGGHFGCGKYFVAEADEYLTCPLTCNKPRFSWQNPKFLLITNIEYDHPDAFSGIEDVKKAFLKFIHQLPQDGMLVVCIDSHNIKQLLPLIKRQYLTYGFSPQAQYRITKNYIGDGVNFMHVMHENIDLGEFMVKIAGKHNLLNVLGASIISNLIGVSWEKIKKSLKKFTGTNRRFEKIGEWNGISLYDDYAHHPSEIMATLQAFREWFPNRRLIVIFQPHTFSRTKALLFEFAKSFYMADIALITDIYSSAREKPDLSISSKILAAEVNKHKKNAYYQQTKEATLILLKKILSPGDMVVTMGAGDIYLWHDEIKELLKHYDRNNDR